MRMVMMRTIMIILIKVRIMIMILFIMVMMRIIMIIILIKAALELQNNVRLETRFVRAGENFHSFTVEDWR